MDQGVTLKFAEFSTRAGLLITRLRHLRIFQALVGIMEALVGIMEALVGIMEALVGIMEVLVAKMEALVTECRLLWEKWRVLLRQRAQRSLRPYPRAGYQQKILSLQSDRGIIRTKTPLDLKGQIR